LEAARLDIELAELPAVAEMCQQQLPLAAISRALSANCRGARHSASRWSIRAFATIADAMAQSRLAQAAEHLGAIAHN